MSHPSTSQRGSVQQAVKEAIETAIADSTAEVTGEGGHFEIVVTAPAFAGKSMLESQRLVYAAIGHLMAGDAAPVHAIDRLKTRAP